MYYQIKQVEILLKRDKPKCFLLTFLDPGSSTRLRDTLWYEMKIYVQQHEVFLSNDALKIFSPIVNIIVVKTFQIL